MHHALPRGGGAVVAVDRRLAGRLGGMGGGRGAVVRWLGLGRRGAARSPGGDGAGPSDGPGVRHVVFAAAVFAAAASAWPRAPVVREGSAADAPLAVRRRVVLENPPSARPPRPDALGKFQVILWFLTAGSG